MFQVSCTRHLASQQPATSQTREMETSDGDTLTLHHPALAPLEFSNLDINNYGELLIQTIIHGNYY